jgi:hypothetical protein
MGSGKALHDREHASQCGCSRRSEAEFPDQILQGVRLAAVEGMGIVLTTLPAFRREFARGSLVQVLPESVDVHAVFTNGRAAKPSARAIVAYFADILPRA